MSTLRSAPAKALLEAAKADRPSAAARAKVWAGVREGAGFAGASGAAAGTALSKIFTMGSLFGGTVTVGVAAALLYVSSHRFEERRATSAERFGGDVTNEGDNARAMPPMTRDIQLETWSVGRLPLRPAPIEDEATVVPDAQRDPGGPRPKWRQRDPGVLHPEGPQRNPGVPHSKGWQRDPGVPHSKGWQRDPGVPHSKGPPAMDPSDVRGAPGLFAREAGLVDQARACLSRQDGAGALRALTLAMALPSRQLEPEELAMLAPALRLLGRADEANEADRKLKASYPQSELARSR